MNEQTVLFDLLKEGVSPAHVVKSCEKRLEDAGFEKIAYEKEWNLKAGGRYYVDHHDTTLFAFTIPEDEMKKEEKPAVRIAAAHTDFPCLRIKPSCDVVTNRYAQVNIEVYGGAILNTWLDRPLGVAGRVAVRGNDPFVPEMKYFASEKNLLTIPNLAIHMNREVNKGVELNKQIDMIPVAGLLAEEEKNADYFLSFLAKELSVAKEDILDFELSVYCKEQPEYVGVADDFISSPRLDNLTSCAALVSGILDAERKDGINLIALFDHEEIGSRSKQGAGSILLHDMLLRILAECGAKESAQGLLYQSMLLSVDVAHGLHPNQAGKMDITNKPVLGSGFCIKEACSQSYATDCEAIAIGLGDTRFPLVISLIGMWGVRCVLAPTLVFGFKIGLAGSWIAMVCDLCVRGLLCALRFKRFTPQYLAENHR